MHFFLTTLNLSRYLTEVKPVLPADNTDPRALTSLEAWRHNDFLCKGYIQNRLVDQLFNVYTEIEISKDLWDALEKKYKSFNVGSRKFATSKISKLRDGWFTTYHGASTWAAIDLSRDRWRRYEALWDLHSELLHREASSKLGRLQKLSCLQAKYLNFGTLNYPASEWVTETWQRWAIPFSR